MKTFEFLGYKCVAEKAVYNNGRVALTVVSTKGEPITTATVNLHDSIIPEGYAAIKNYNENEGILEVLIKAGVIASESHATLQSGHINNIPVHQILI